MSEERKKIILEEYKKTIDIVIYEGTIYWQRFNVLFAVNAAILVFLGVLAGSQIPSFHSENPQRILVYASCAIGFISSTSMIFSCLRSQAFYRSWWNHIENLEKKELKEFSLMKDLGSYLKKQSFVRQTSLMTLSILIPFSFSALFVVLPMLLYGQDAIFYLCTVILIGAFLLLYIIYSACKKSWQRDDCTSSSHQT